MNTLYKIYRQVYTYILVTILSINLVLEDFAVMLVGSAFQLNVYPIMQCND